MSRPKRGTRGSRSARPGWDAHAGAAQDHPPASSGREAGSTPRGGARAGGPHGQPGNPTDGPAAVAGFPCAHCGALIPENAPGTGQRNHCPHCLWSLHVDIRPGDRASLCKGEMEPIALWASDGGELRIIHRCSRCGVMKPNRIAGDDSEQVLLEIQNRTSDALGASMGGDG